MLNAVNITQISLLQLYRAAAADRQVFAIFVMVVAAAEVADGLAIILAIFRGLCRYTTSITST
jgi:NADH:ubiquinone oxidoreductase subunit K